MKKIYLLALAVIGFSANSFAQSSATATATAIIITPISIAKTIDMNFGNIAVGGSAGTVVLTPLGARSSTGGVTLPVTAGTVTAASFTVTGLGTSTYLITLPAVATTLTSGANTMTATLFTSVSPTGTLAAGGTQVFTVGATLNVGATQAAGTYVSGTPFTVTVNYN
jgi:hypothetical protein